MLKWSFVFRKVVESILRIITGRKREESRIRPRRESGFYAVSARPQLVLWGSSRAVTTLKSCSKLR